MLRYESDLIHTLVDNSAIAMGVGENATENRRLKKRSGWAKKRRRDEQLLEAAGSTDGPSDKTAIPEPLTLL